MKLMDEPFDRYEKDNALRSLDGCICRICVSDDPLEIVRMLGFANDYLAMLAQNRMLQLRREECLKKANGRHGRWKGAGLGDYYCSLCNYIASGADRLDFCPECNAYMKE